MGSSRKPVSVVAPAAAPVAAPAPALCGCGCGVPTKPRRSFAQGHDAKLHSRLLAEARAGSAEAVSALTARGWSLPAAPRAAKARVAPVVVVVTDAGLRSLATFVS